MIHPDLNSFNSQAAGRSAMHSLNHAHSVGTNAFISHCANYSLGIKSLELT